EAAADVQVAEGRPLLHQVDVVAAGLADAGADVLDVGDLATQVKVHQAQAVEHIGGLEQVHRLDQLLGVEAEEAPVATVLAPVAVHLGAELQTRADHGLDAEGAAALDDQRHLLGGFHHEDAGHAELAGPQAEVDELLVLVAIADDETLPIPEHGHGHQQLSLAAGLEAVVVARAEAGDLLDDVGLLVDLDGEHAA